MADALMGITEVTAASKAEIAPIVQSYLQQASVLLPAVTDYSYLAQKGVKSIGVPRSAGFTVNDKAENTAIDSQVLTYSADTIALTKHKVVQFLLEKFADRAANVRVVEDAIMKATKDISYQIDKDIITELEDVSTDTPDHSLVFIDTTTDVIAKGDILAARALLGAQNIDPRECFIGVGPEKENEMLGLADFIQAERYGSNMPVQLGEFGRIFGMRVLVSNGFADKMLVWHPSSVGFAFANGMQVDSQKDLANLATRYSVDVIYGVETLDVTATGGKRNVLVDSTN